MKVLHLSSSRYGGAGLAAERLHKALLKSRVDSTLITREILEEKATQLDWTYEAKKFKSKLLTYFQMPGKLGIDSLVTPWTIDFTTEISRLIEIEDFDVVHLHATYNFINFESVVKSFPRGLVITLHDQRLLTGGCHYSRNCQRYQDKCSNCPQARKAFQSVIQNQHLDMIELSQKLRKSNLRIVAPSSWLVNEASKSSVLRECNIEQIYNTIPDIYFDYPKKVCINSEKLVVGFVSNNLRNPYKGLEYLIRAVKEINYRGKDLIELRLLGSKDFLLETSGYSIEQASTDYETIAFLDTLDVLMVPSEQDNSPNVMLEGLARNVWVSGSEVGGIKEILDEFGMFTFPVGDFEALTSVLEWYLRHKNAKTNSQEKARNLFSNEVIAKQHISLYGELMSRS